MHVENPYRHLNKISWWKMYLFFKLPITAHHRIMMSHCMVYYCFPTCLLCIMYIVQCTKHSCVMHWWSKSDLLTWIINKMTEVGWSSLWKSIDHRKKKKHPMASRIIDNDVRSETKSNQHPVREHYYLW